LNSRIETEPISAVAEIGIKDVEIGLVRFRLAARFQRVLDFKVQTRSGLPCDEWDGAAGRRPTARSTDCLSGLTLEQIIERVDTLFLQDSPQLSVRSVSLREIVAVFFSK